MYIMYIQQHTRKQPFHKGTVSTLIAAFLLESSTTNQSIPNNIIYSTERDIP